MQTETDWLQEKATLLKSIEQKQEKLRDYEQVSQQESKLKIIFSGYKYGYKFT